MSRLYGAALALIALLSSTTAHAALIPAEVVLRKFCIENGVTVANCFSDLNTLNAWIWDTRKPTQGYPLHVVVGPGNFTGSFSCNPTAVDSLTGIGYVTVTGAGIGNSVLSGTQPLLSKLCRNLVFESLTIEVTGNGIQGVVNQGGTTVWNNVEIRSPGYAWADGLSNQGCQWTPGKHTWFNSRIVATSAASSSLSPGAAVGYYNNCDEAWFYGTEIIANLTSSGGDAKAILAFGGKLHFYGGSLRTNAGMGILTNNLDVVFSNYPSEVHIHGTGIDVHSTEANNVTSLHSVGGKIHANASAYVLQSEGGAIYTRVDNEPGFDGRIAAPYEWEPNDFPWNIRTELGSDRMTITKRYHCSLENPDHSFTACDPTIEGGSQCPGASVCQGDVELRQLLSAPTNCASSWYEPATKSCYYGHLATLPHHDP